MAAPVIISDESYEEDLQIIASVVSISGKSIQIIDLEKKDSGKSEPVKSSFRSSTSKESKPVIIDLEKEETQKRYDFLNSFGNSSRPIIIDLECEPIKTYRRRRTKKGDFVKPFDESSKTEKGQSSSHVCEICMEPKSSNEIFYNVNCSHRFCSDCISQHIAAKIQDNIVMIKCPDLQCSSILELGFCRDILPKEVFERWGDALCEATILGSERFYCPFNDCSALLIDEREGGGGEAIRESECLNCNRLFCANCKVPWHSGFGCEDFQKLNVDERGREDLMVLKLADEKNWQRCPKCRVCVERIDGCLFMKCRCGVNFCYRCGTTLSGDHYCPKCTRAW